MEVAEESKVRGEQQKASDEALCFMASIEPTELQKCVLSDSLVTMSEGGRDLGEFTMTVEFTRRFQLPCILLRAHSQGAIDDCPCGTAVTAYLSAELEVLEEDHREYVKLEGHSLDKRCHMVQHDGELLIEKVTTVGEDVTKESVSYPMSDLRGLVTEGSGLLLMRLIALRKEVSENMTFISFDKDSHIISTTYSQLGLKQLDVGGEMLEVFGVERTVHSVEDSPTTWHCYFLSDGHLASRVQLGSPVTMRLLQLSFQQEQEKGFEKTSLVWTEDMQLRSKFLDRKEELKAEHASYLRRHPEIRALVADFLQFLLLKKPDDVFQFAQEYFLPYVSHQIPETSPSL
ncbi:ciliogenesis-associated TTC17-interacting protein [Genypterus blacodes]|uniref:ciliogenesis-associated TTC17-interacting protein n=1 Tax=Genypterus blacodes TaxID=154954 RepID=UPI003F75C65C